MKAPADYRVLEAKAQRRCTSQTFELFSILLLKILTISLHCNLFSCRCGGLANRHSSVPIMSDIKKTVEYELKHILFLD